MHNFKAISTKIKYQTFKDDSRLKLSRKYHLNLPPKAIVAPELMEVLKAVDKSKMIDPATLRFVDVLETRIFQDYKNFLENGYLRYLSSNIAQEFILNMFEHSNPSPDHSKPVRMGYGINYADKHGPVFYVFFKCNNLNFTEKELAGILRLKRSEDPETISFEKKMRNRGLYILKKTYPKSRFEIQRGGFGRFDSKFVFLILLPKEKIQITLPDKPR